MSHNFSLLQNTFVTDVIVKIFPLDNLLHIWYKNYILTKLMRRKAHIFVNNVC
jgi:hypothetical protein